MLSISYSSTTVYRQVWLQQLLSHKRPHDPQPAQRAPAASVTITMSRCLSAALIYELHHPTTDARAILRLHLFMTSSGWPTPDVFDFGCRPPTTATGLSLGRGWENYLLGYYLCQLTSASRNKEIWFCSFLTLNLTSCKFYLIHMSWVPFMTLTPLLTLTHRRQVEDNFIILQKIEYLDVFCCHSGYRQCTEFLKKRFRKLISRRFWTYL